MKKVLLFALAACLTLPAFAQTADKAKLDKYFDVLEANNKYMGSVQLSQDGKVIYQRAIGYADAEAGKKITPQSKFRIGSISKTFTASMIFKAVEEKKLSLEDKLDKFYPTIPNASKITIAYLLGHNSGIHNFTNDESYGAWETMPKTHAEMVDVIAKGGSDFEPGTSTDYSNSGYVLLGYILEKVYNKPYKDLLTEKITKPLGLKDTYYGGKISTANNEVYSYHFESKWDKGTETDMSIPGGAGSIVSTPSDLSKFIEALFAGKVVSQASLDKMKTISQGYGMGLFQFPFGEQKAFGHTGGIDGFRSMLSYFPEKKITLAMTSNGVNMNTNNIAIALLSWANNMDFEIPTFTTYSHTAEELTQFAGFYESKEFPIPITVTKDGMNLVAEASGQKITLEATDKGKFKYEQADIVMDFNPAEKQMVLKQGGGTFTFTKK